MSWADTKAILLELEQLYNRDDDIKDILDVKKMEAEIEIQMTNRLKDSKEIIKVMTSQLAVKEASIAAPSQADHATALKKVANKENLENQMETIVKTIDVKKQNIAKMTSTVLNLKERENEFVINSEMADSRTAYKIALYSKISNITWNYQAPDGRLAGYIGSDRDKDFKPFDLDTRSMNSFEVANNLWKLIEQSV